MPSNIAVRDLKKSYGPVTALAGVSFDVGEGEIFGLLGPNGAGKTTTLECLVGLRVADEGAIDVGGFDARRRPRAIQQRIGVMLQTTALQPRITAREALHVFGSFYDRREETAVLLERFALSDHADTRFERLSGGYRQRLALALAFVNRPDIVFLDEPTAGLDPQSRRELRNLIGGVRREGRSVLMTTHDVDEAERLCDRVAIIDHGVIAAIDRPAALVASSPSARTLEDVFLRLTERHAEKLQ